MKVLIDDKRIALPDGTTPDLIARTYQAGLAVMNLLTSGDELYLDHDLGETDVDHTGYRILSLFVDDVDQDFVPESAIPCKVVCVSDNAYGRMRIQQLIDKLTYHI